MHINAWNVLYHQANCYGDSAKSAVGDNYIFCSGKALGNEVASVVLSGSGS